MAAKAAVEVLQDHTGFHLNHAGGGIEITNRVELAHEHHNARLQGNTLPVVPCAGSSQSERDRSSGARSSHSHDSGYAMGTDDKLGPAVAQQRRKHRRVVIRVA